MLRVSGLELAPRSSKALLLGILGCLGAGLLLIGFGAPGLRGRPVEMVSELARRDSGLRADGAGSLGARGLRASRPQSHLHTEVYHRAQAAKREAEELRSRRAEARGVHVTKKTALAVPARGPGGRETELVNIAKGTQSLSRAGFPPLEHRYTSTSAPSLRPGL